MLCGDLNICVCVCVCVHICVYTCVCIYIHIHVADSLCVQQKLTQYCKVTILQ